MENTVHAVSTNRADLMAAVIEHLACYLQTGRPRSAHLAKLLLERLAADAENEALGECCQQLSEILEDSGEEPAPRNAPLRKHGPAPWLTWECLGEAA